MTETDPTLAGLLAAVLATPEADVPRLVLADWWEENGEPERAEFVRVQCELQRYGEDRPPNTRWFELVKLELEFIPEYYSGDDPRRDRELAWAGEGVRRASLEIPFKWRRGFIEELTCFPAAWLEHGDAIMKAHPIRRVRLVQSLNNGRQLTELLDRAVQNGFLSEPIRLNPNLGALGSHLLVDIFGWAYHGVTFEMTQDFSCLQYQPGSDGRCQCENCRPEPEPQTLFVWRDRAVRVAYGNWELSARGRHDDWDFFSADPGRAVMGNCGAPVYALEALDADRLRIIAANGSFVLHGDDFDGASTLFPEDAT